MRIDRLDLIAFGPFTNAVLDLSGGAEGLHLVYGPNEAGKSSALRAIRQFFSGIPTQSTDDFVHQYANMRIGALLREPGGETLELVRRKGVKNTLLRSDGKALDDADSRLARLLGGVTPEEFLQKFVIDHAELVGGGKSVVDGRGDLGRTLFSAGSGLAGLGAVQKALDDQAEALFKKGGSKPQINLKLTELEAVRKRLKDDTLKSSEWLAHDEALRNARARKAALERDLEDATRERNRLTRFAEAIEPIAGRRVVLDELHGLADVPRLAANFTYRRREALSYIQVNEETETKALRELGGVRTALEALDVPEPLLDETEAIEAIYKRLGRRQQSTLDRDRLEADRDRLEAEARAIVRDLGHAPVGKVPGEGDDLETLRLTTAQRAEILSLSGDRAALLVARDGAETAIQKLDATRAAAAGKRAALGPDRDPAALRKAVKQGQAQGDLDAQVRQDRESLARDERRAAVALAALGHWFGPLDAAEALAVPSAETVERFQAGFDAEAAEADALRRRGDDLDAQARQADAHLEQLRLTGDIPTEDALAEARGRRDDAWQSLKQARAWDDALADVYEQAARRADDLSDRLRREANRVTERAQVLAQRSRLAADRDDLGARLGQARARLDDLQGRWAALWAPLGVAEAGAPREMLAWLRRQADLAATARSVRETHEAVRRREERISDHRRALVAALNALGAAPGPADEPLADLVDRAEEVIEAVRKESSTRKRLAEEIEAGDRKRDDLEKDAASARAGWARWESLWAAAMRRVKLPPDALPATANAVLQKTADLFDRLDDAQTLGLTLDVLAREAERFTADVRSLADRVAPDLAPSRSAPEAVAEELYNRLKRARDARQKRDSLTDRKGVLEEDARAAGDTITQKRGELAALCREARCGDEDDLPALEERSARRQTLEQERAGLEAQLLKLAAGATLDAFLAEAAQADPDGLAPRIGSQNETIAALGDERGRLDQTIGHEKAELSHMSGSARAADAGQDAEDLRARIKADVEEYARLRLASAVLRAGIERYRKKVQDPVLERASALFSGLTLGSFDGLRVDYNDRDEPVLKGVRAGGRESLGVESMSLGTADQLYLSLRLATLETYLDRRDPLPLVVDDVLIQFDNPRAVATLTALAALSRRTQVLMFTHHEHLRDLAVAHVPPDLLVTHTLPGPLAPTT